MFNLFKRKLNDDEKKIFREEIVLFLRDNADFLKEIIKTYAIKEMEERFTINILERQIQDQVTSYLASKLSRELIANGKIEHLYNEEELKTRITGFLLANLTGHTKL